MPSNTQEYPEIPESKEYNQKYPILYFSTPTWPKPNRYPVFFQMPDPTRYWKTLPVVGHCSCRGGEVKICFFLLQGFNLAVLAQALAMLAFHVHFFMLICLHYVQGSVQVFAKCCRVTALVVPRADNSQRQNLQQEGGSKSEAEHKGNDRETTKSRRQYVRENREKQIYRWKRTIM